jgi:hypothetical protein
MISAEQLFDENQVGQEKRTPEISPSVARKKTFVVPQIMEPQGVLETTKFFFQSAAAGSGLIAQPGHDNHRHQ